ncbi:hypothetical protein BJY52DRAFT_1222968 [Lactarius psammicola]|nr:hypothetical protein BJY52DRAFT_1222968 [Lactarius psammicola]
MSRCYYSWGGILHTGLGRSVPPRVKTRFLPGTTLQADWPKVDHCGASGLRGAATVRTLAPEPNVLVVSLALPTLTAVDTALVVPHWHGCAYLEAPRTKFPYDVSSPLLHLRLRLVAPAGWLESMGVVLWRKYGEESAAMPTLEVLCAWFGVPCLIQANSDGMRLYSEHASLLGCFWSHLLVLLAKSYWLYRTPIALAMLVAY